MKGLTTFFAANFAVSRYNVRTYDKLDQIKQMFAKITAAAYSNSVLMSVKIMQSELLLMFVLSCRCRTVYPVHDIFPRIGGGLCLRLGSFSVS